MAAEIFSYSVLFSPEIFVFCLSTRAGGLGINLTAADTVIFCLSFLPPLPLLSIDRPADPASVLLCRRQ